MSNFLIWAPLWENRSSGFPTRSDTNQAVQPQKMARGLKFCISEVDGLYYLCSENKGDDQLRGTRSWSASLFSHMQKSGFLMTQFIFRYRGSSMGAYVLLTLLTAAKRATIAHLRANINLWGLFRCSRAANSTVSDPIWRKFKLTQNRMYEFITCKFKKYLINSNTKSGTINFLKTRWQLSPKSVVRSGRNSNSFKL